MSAISVRTESSARTIDTSGPGAFLYEASAEISVHYDAAHPEAALKALNDAYAEARKRIEH